MTTMDEAPRPRVLVLHVQDPWYTEIAAGRKDIAERVGPAAKYEDLVWGHVVLETGDGRRVVRRAVRTITAVRHYATLEAYIAAEGWARCAPHTGSAGEAMAAYGAVRTKAGESVFSVQRVAAQGGIAALELGKISSQSKTRSTTGESLESGWARWRTTEDGYLERRAAPGRGGTRAPAREENFADQVRDAVDRREAVRAAFHARYATALEPLPYDMPLQSTFAYLYGIHVRYRRADYSLTGWPPITEQLHDDLCDLFSDETGE